MLCFFTTHCSLRLIVQSELDVPNFATRRFHACHHARAPSGGSWNCEREMSGKFCLNADFHVTFRYLLHVPTFATRRFHACHHARARSGGSWNCEREMLGKFCLNADLHFTFRYLLHAVKLRHRTDGFTSPPKEGVLRIFSPYKSDGFGRV